MQSGVEKCPSDFRVALRRVYSFRFLMRTSCGLAWGNQRQAGRVSAALKCWSLWGVRARQVMNPLGCPGTMGESPRARASAQPSSAHKSTIPGGDHPQHFTLLSAKPLSAQKPDLKCFGELAGLLVLQSAQISVCVMERF